MTSFIHLLATNGRHKNWREKYARFAVVLWKRFSKCALLDSWADESAQNGVQDCACANLSSGHTGSYHHFPNWNKPHATTPHGFHSDQGILENISTSRTSGWWRCGSGWYGKAQVFPWPIFYFLILLFPVLLQPFQFPLFPPLFYLLSLFLELQ